MERTEYLNKYINDYYLIYRSFKDLENAILAEIPLIIQKGFPELKKASSLKTKKLKSDGAVSYRCLYALADVEFIEKIPVNQIEFSIQYSEDENNSKPIVGLCLKFKNAENLTSFYANVPDGKDDEESDLYWFEDKDSIWLKMIFDDNQGKFNTIPELEEQFKFLMRRFVTDYKKYTK